MRVGILGTGAMAVALGTVWQNAGHEVLVAGRSADRAADAARRIGATAVTPSEAVVDRDAVLVAVLWPGVQEILRAAGASDGSLAGTTVIDPTNAVTHGIGELLPTDGRAAAEHLADWAPGAQVVKAFHLVPASYWGNGVSVTVPLAGDDAASLRLVERLVRDAGGVPAVVGSLRRARQLEEVAGFAIGLAFAGVDPRSALPAI